jgi:hypothetical protein
MLAVYRLGPILASRFALMFTSLVALAYVHLLFLNSKLSLSRLPGLLPDALEQLAVAIVVANRGLDYMSSFVRANTWVSVRSFGERLAATKDFKELLASRVTFESARRSNTSSPFSFLIVSTCGLWRL